MSHFTVFVLLIANENFCIAIIVICVIVITTGSKTNNRNSVIDIILSRGKITIRTRCFFSNVVRESSNCILQCFNACYSFFYITFIKLKLCRKLICSCGSTYCMGNIFFVRISVSVNILILVY